MAKTNFQYEKRQRELEKKRKAEDKARRKLEAKQHKVPGEEESSGDDPPGDEQVGAAEEGEKDTA